MSKIRKYSSSPAIAQMMVFEGSRVEFVASYYPAKGFYSPRYHFENFNLSFAELNYEIARFIRFICKLTADPTVSSRLDYIDAELDGKNLDLVGDNQLFPKEF